MKQAYMIAAVALAGMAFLFMIQWNTTGLLPYKQQVCTRVVPDASLGVTPCLTQARQLCAEVHIPYMSDTSRYNSCYNWCVEDAQSLCYR